jgi:hypothetical protein
VAQGSPIDPAGGVCANCAAPELAQLDFKTLGSLGGLLRPGYLAAEYLAGRRQRYLSPLKTYLLAAALFFVAAPYVFGFSQVGTMRLTVALTRPRRGGSARGRPDDRASRRGRTAP